MSKQLEERFLSYVKKNTRSNEASTSVPSTSIQTDFLKDLELELKDLGFADVRLNPKDSYLTARIPANTDQPAPTIGFISHVDTADFESENIQPQKHVNYDGHPIILNQEEDITLDPSEFPNLKNYVGQTLITTDGTTLLGSDDKSGVAEIVTAGARLLDNPDIKHGEIRLAFGPDEEIGRGADLFDLANFPCDFAYTVDGGPVGELQYESFNAAQAKITIKGKNVHPGKAKDSMVNALELARAFQNKLPDDQVPEKTNGREGFYHLTNLNGRVEEAELVYIIRDHDNKLFKEKKAYIEKVAQELNKTLDKDRVFVDMEDQYYNMADIIKKDLTPVDLAQKAMEALDIDPIIEPIRGGTDGSKLSFRGLPCPNLFAGGENFHGRYEFVALESMEKACQVILKIAQLAVSGKNEN
ncbi:Peptidase T [Alloiococcus otitis]|uniref:Peptidase T n=1 Tax=Alloiococcus otitis ATCC 51267 TaxID=883081 RepID=K9EXU7_9LACT|nr:peptidase T [Alloiococcus otitis]EKU94070.1 peptidase T [Alloiococcus otitis ATCC 51267]SUU81016.1 Peptidase T [Alloiococcus otitis]